MADVFSKEKRSLIMSLISSKNTKPEVTLRKALHRRGYRFRIHVKALLGNPDIVFPMYRTVIQVRGCFWHGHQCMDGHIPHSNREYWSHKLIKNKKRDSRNDRALRRDGWSVIVVWECKLQSEKKLEKEVNRILRILSRGKRDRLLSLSPLMCTIVHSDGLRLCRRKLLFHPIVHLKNEKINRDDSRYFLAI